MDEVGSAIPKVGTDSRDVARAGCSAKTCPLGGQRDMEDACNVSVEHVSRVRRNDVLVACLGRKVPKQLALENGVNVN